MFKKSVTNAIRKRNHTMDAVAIYMEVSRRSVYNWLDNPKSIPVGKLSQLAKITGINEMKLIRLINKA